MMPNGETKRAKPKIHIGNCAQRTWMSCTINWRSFYKDRFETFAFALDAFSSHFQLKERAARRLFSSQVGNGEFNYCVGRFTLFVMISHLSFLQLRFRLSSMHISEYAKRSTACIEEYLNCNWSYGHQAYEKLTVKTSIVRSHDRTSDGART